jgi:hypothetical protein
MEAILGTSALPGRGSLVNAQPTAGKRPSCPSDLDRRARRDRRFVCLLIGVWIVNCFDLELTLLAAQQRMLWELNPLVSGLISFGPKALTFYKFALLAMGSLILWRYRQYRIASLALWVVAIACVVLSLVWYQLYFGAVPAWGGINTAYTVAASSM